MVPLSSTCITMWSEKQGTNRKKPHRLLLDPQPRTHNAFLFLKRKRGGRERGSRKEGRVMKGERGKEKAKGSGRGEEKGRRGKEGCLTGL